MNEIKYCPDGKKVMVVGQLNKNQAIVKEIFVTPDGEEFTAGESFAVDKLFDEPVKSWQQVKIDEAEAKLEQLKKDYEARADRIRSEGYSTVKAVQSQYIYLRDKVRYLQQFNDKIKNSDLKSIIHVLMNILSGKPMWCVYHAGTCYHIIPYNNNEIDDFAIAHDEYGHSETFSSLKILELFAQPDRTLAWRTQYHYTSSGFCQFFDTLEQAKAYVEERVSAPDYRICSKDIQQAREDGVKLPVEKVRKYYQDQIKYYQGKMLDNQQLIEKERTEIDALESELKEYLAQQ
jgi:hypothetical protein